MYSRAEEVIDGMRREGRYKDCVRCWLSAAPVSAADFFRRWLFAYASIQTGWERNMVIYNALKDLKWVGDDEELRRRLVQTKAGMHNVRAKNIAAFARDYWSNPAEFYGRPGETWSTYRTRLISRIPGMGIAKTSFVLEMTWPIRAGVICIDTHIAQLYDYDPGKLTESEYVKFENHWVTCSRAKGMAPAITRALYWDSKQGYKNSDYWNCVFNDEKTIFERVRRLKRKIEVMFNV